MSSVRPSLPAAIKFIRSVLPDAEWIVRHINNNGGWIRFPPLLMNAMSKLRIENYVELYDDERKLQAAAFVGLLGKEGVAKLVAETRDMTGPDATRFLDELLHESSEDGYFQLPHTEAEVAAARREFERMSKAEQAELTLRAQCLYSGAFGLFYELLSIMVHGEKLTALIRQATWGNDEAFGKAVQIDRAILTGLRYFRERSLRAQMEGDSGFLDVLAYRIKNPVIRGKIKYRQLWLVFSLLELLNLLEQFSARELLDVCDQVGLDPYENRIDDEGYLRKRLKQYREFQARAVKIVH